MEMYAWGRVSLFLIILYPADLGHTFADYVIQQSKQNACHDISINVKVPICVKHHRKIPTQCFSYRRQLENKIQHYQHQWGLDFVVKLVHFVLAWFTARILLDNFLRGLVLINVVHVLWWRWWDIIGLNLRILRQCFRVSRDVFRWKLGSPGGTGHLQSANDLVYGSLV